MTIYKEAIKNKWIFMNHDQTISQVSTDLVYKYYMKIYEFIKVRNKSAHRNSTVHTGIQLQTLCI